MELLKAGGERALTVLTGMIMGVLRGEQLPEDFRIGHLSSIYKKGDCRSCRKYRGISVQN